MTFSGRSLLDPRMVAQLQEMWMSRCTIQIASGSTTDSGQTIPSGFLSIAGMIDIPCRIAPLLDDTITNRERPSPIVIGQENKWEVRLNSYYPQIFPRQHYALIDGTRYLIRGVEHDSERHATKLALEYVAPFQDTL